jgi:hypothetical protein
LQPGNSPKDFKESVSPAAQVYAEMSRLQESAELTFADFARFQAAMDRLRAKLRFYGRLV